MDFSNFLSKAGQNIVRKLTKPDFEEKCFFQERKGKSMLGSIQVFCFFLPNDFKDFSDFYLFCHSENLITLPKRHFHEKMCSSYIPVTRPLRQFSNILLHAVIAVENFKTI